MTVTASAATQRCVPWPQQQHLCLQRQPSACSLQRLAPTGQPLATRSLRLRCSHLPSATCVYPQPFQQRRRSVNSDSHFSDDSDSPSRSLALAAKNATRFLWCFSDGNLCSGAFACAASFSNSDVRHMACPIEAFNISLASAAFTYDVCFAVTLR